MLAEEEHPVSRVGNGDRWRLFIKLIQSIWRTGTIPQQLTWIIVVLIPKGGGDYRGIGLMEPFWKVIEMIMERRLQAIQLHNCLHRSVQRRGTGTAILKAKLVQQLAYLRQTLLYEVFIDLRKAYDAMDRRRTLMILEAYGVGQNMLHLI